MIERSGHESGSVPLTNGSGRPKNLRILQARIRNTACKDYKIQRLARLENAVLIPHVFLEGVDILEKAVAELALQQHGDGGVHVLDVTGQAVLVDPLQAVRTRGIPSCNTTTVTSQTLRNR
jgi:hypothetical protein